MVQFHSSIYGRPKWQEEVNVQNFQADYVHKCCQHLHIYLFSSSLASSKSSYKLLTNTSKYLKLNLTYPLYTTIHIVSTRNTSYLHHKTLDIYLIFSFPCQPSTRCRFKEVLCKITQEHIWIQLSR